MQWSHTQEIMRIANGRSATTHVLHSLLVTMNNCTPCCVQILKTCRSCAYSWKVHRTVRIFLLCLCFVLQMGADEGQTSQALMYAQKVSPALEDLQHSPADLAHWSHTTTQLWQLVSDAADQIDATNITTNIEIGGLDSVGLDPVAQDSYTRRNIWAYKDLLQRLVKVTTAVTEGDLDDANWALTTAVIDADNNTLAWSPRVLAIPHQQLQEYVRPFVGVQCWSSDVMRRSGDALDGLMARTVGVSRSEWNALASAQHSQLVAFGWKYHELPPWQRLRHREWPAHFKRQTVAILFALHSSLPREPFILVLIVNAVDAHKRGGDFNM